MSDTVAVKIEYCTSWGGFLREATRVVAELLAERHTQISEVAVTPSSGGVFKVTVGNKVIFSKQESNRYPDEGEIPRLFGEALQ